MLVPERSTKFEPSPSQSLFADFILVPGAAISGFTRPSKVGPLLLPFAITSLLLSVVPPSFTFATLNALYAIPPTVPLLGPLFPAELTTEIPKSSTTASKNLAISQSETELSHIPILLLTTSAPAVLTAQSMANILSLLGQDPCPSSVL